ncbi:transcriptional regulator, IclR family [Tistlia consotensis]|uniref:Transcriptional regulator, IclR family n=1 Tax=Tistlia consotensis USBA 355 TaxID=560819 RepID=A0A1Y6C1R9_9PROT|nr:IclR family transcriptional regulator [Tistlia consotensis]SMF29210.1 transcriptional regulator, IclR family [Tistlia consotensis USBA 355]SNR91498.1 transcriptional regulator, IclR family [Tistlia consotensis]
MSDERTKGLQDEAGAFPMPERGVPALIRGSRVLDAVMLSERPPTVSDLARQLDLAKSTVHGLCSTLAGLGLLARRPGNAFVIGPHVMRWANAFLAQTDLTAEFSALWDDQAALTDETITLSVLDGPEVVYIACRNSASPLGITFRIGMRLPAAFTATGKAILSTMPDAQVRALFQDGWPEPLTRYSVGDVEALLGELADCRRRGYSIDNGQTREGMYCFGTPVRDSSNEVVAGVAVSLLAARVDGPTTALAADCVCTIAHQLSLRLGADVEGER